MRRKFFITLAFTLSLSAFGVGCISIPRSSDPDYEQSNYAAVERTIHTLRDTVDANKQLIPYGDYAAAALGLTGMVMAYLAKDKTETAHARIDGMKARKPGA